MNHLRALFVAAGAACALLWTACTTAEPELAGSDDDAIHDPSDFEDDASGKADSGDLLSRFLPHRVVSDDAFFDVDAMTAADVQRFLEVTPYDGKRSFLADEDVHGTTVGEALVAVARENGLNPLVLLVTLQKEAGLISRTVPPNRKRVDFAFGCGCLDGKPCLETFRGLDRQLSCAGERLGEYHADLLAGEPTIGGYFPGKSHRVLDKDASGAGMSVVPANRSTAMLYTYTPWIAVGTGGNWLFWNVWRKYSNAIGYARGLSSPFSEGYIGGACSDDADCFFDGGLCDGGTCTKACTSTCPDRVGFATTFCVTGSSGSGSCVAQCDDALGGATRCGESLSCTIATRHSDDSVERDVCMP